MLHGCFMMHNRSNFYFVFKHLCIIVLFVSFKDILIIQACHKADFVFTTYSLVLGVITYIQKFKEVIVSPTQYCCFSDRELVILKVPEWIASQSFFRQEVIDTIPEWIASPLFSDWEL